MKIFACAGAQIVPIVQPFICRKNLELNAKLFNVRMSARNVAIILVSKVLCMQLSYLFLVAAIPWLFGILVYNDFTSIVTKTELIETKKLFTLMMKWFVSFIFEGICFTTGWRWWWTNLEISDVRHTIEFITGLPGLLGLRIFDEM